MPSRMTTAAWRRGMKNALFCGVGVAVVLVVLTLAVKAVFGLGLRDSGAIAFGVFWALIFAAFLIGQLLGRNASGPLLLDCGPSPVRRILFVNAILYPLLGIGGVFAFFSNKFDTYGVAGVLFGLSASIFNLVQAFGRLQFRKNGIWQYWGLLKWRKIESYEWEESGADPTLLIRTRTRLSFLGRGALPVPMEHKDAVADLMAEYCGKSAKHDDNCGAPIVARTR